MNDDLREMLAKAKGSAATARIVRLTPPEEGIAPAADPGRWSLETLSGRLVELSARGATATLTIAIELVLEAQLAAEPAAWVTLSNATFFPPDVADSGVDLAALVVVRV